MFCINCGKQIRDGSRFCPYCGANLTSGDEKAPAYTPPEPVVSPVAERRRLSGRLIIGGAAALALVVAVIIASVSGLFATPKGKLERALVKTASAYAQAVSKAGLPDLSGLAKGKSYSQSFSVELSSVSRDLSYWYDLSGLKGFGMRASTDCDQKGRKFALDAAIMRDDEDLASIQLLVNNDTLTFASPELTDGKAYGVNTETLGADLHKLGADKGGDVSLKNISFNIFDLVEKAAVSDERTKEMTKAISKANKALLDAVEVAKGGRRSVQVNGRRMDAAVYSVTVPRSALKDYAVEIVDVMRMADNSDIRKDIFQSMGFDRSTVNKIVSKSDTSYYYDQIESDLKEAVKALGDVELEVCVSGGCVVAVEYSDSVDGSDVDVELQLGGGDSYVDNLSLEISIDGDKVTIESSGNHAGKGGVFTDETVIRAGSDRITSELHWEPRASGSNLEWEFKSGSVISVSLEGNLTTAKSSFDLRLDDLSVKASGVKMLSLEAGYSVGPCKGVKMALPSPKLLADMDLDDLRELAECAADWADGMTDRYPILYYIF